jgi:lipopolysaccharide transport system ATP-binding protein
MNPVISFDRVSKRFFLQSERPRSFQDLALNLLHRRNRQREVFWAVKDVSLAVPRGEMVGLVGPNGAGKSTILKLMTRILEPTSGAIAVNGRVAALLELGTGFHPDLTGRENVFLNGSLLGFSRRQMQERLDSIIEFAGMRRFIDVPVRHYSSGMYMRLGFAIAVHSDPDILITDEVLAVGDEAFQNKCLERMSKFRDDGVTIILVSHALPVVRTLCDRVIWLQQGSVVMDGDPDAVVDAYVADAATQGHEHEAVVAAHPRHSAPVVTGLADVRLLGLEMIAPDGQARWHMQAGERMTARLHYQARKNFPDAVITLQIHDAGDDAFVCGFNSHSEQMPTPLSEGGGYIALPNLPLPLRDGRYTLTAALFRQPAPPGWAMPDDQHSKAYTLSVSSALTSPQRRWGSGEALIDDVRLCGARGEEKKDFATGETMGVHLRCMSVGTPVSNPIVRAQIYDANGVLCHATNTERIGVTMGILDAPREATLTYVHLDLLEGDYVLSVGLTPADAPRQAYDWHDRAYCFRVSSEYRHGAGLAALSHRWTLSE